MEATNHTMEASQLGFKPGIWPDEVCHQGKTWTRREINRASNGEIAYVLYTTPGAAGGNFQMTVFND